EAKRSKKEKDDAVRIDYLTRRINERKISIEMVEKCIQIGKRIEKNGAYHYIMENFHVVLDRSESTVITAYNKANQKIAA
ncbi:MAG: DUF4258 domain-containing protein, partial [Bacteriovoracaceae bacterium]|nr:DUF4258 domain-containing protein [Bacteriovoracaceae bacterium]